MKNNSSFHHPVNPRSRLAVAALLAAATMLLACLCGTASAQRNPMVGRDGKIHACYRVKGKPKGALRVVRNARTHCRSGERKVAWAVAGVEGMAGSTGTTGTSGEQGQDGTQGAISSTLTEQVKSLSARIDGLEATLAGIGNSDLMGMLATLKGLNNEGLTRAVKSLPAIEAVCKQDKSLTEQVNLIAEVVKGLGLNGALKTLGGLLEIPALPTPLGAFTCSSF
jgi:hypothetical protein